MSAVVMLFDRFPGFAPFPVADWSDEATLRRVRMAALSAGCNPAQVKRAEGYAQGLIAGGMPKPMAVEAARTYASRLYSEARQQMTEGAA
jgi:hypothetical protein